MTEVKLLTQMDITTCLFRLQKSRLIIQAEFLRTNSINARFDGLCDVTQKRILMTRRGLLGRDLKMMLIAEVLYFHLHATRYSIQGYNGLKFS
jgi:hypothetical protein